MPSRLFYFILLAAHLALVWWLPYFPTQDGPSHLYNLTVLHDLLHGGREWGQYFSADLKATPNLGFNLVTYPLLSIVSPLVAERIFLSLYLVLMALAMPLLISTFTSTPSTEVQPIWLLSVPVWLNFTLMMGFYSYLIAVPVFLLALSCSWRLRAKTVTWRMACWNGIGVLIYFIHLIPFVLYLIALLIFVLAEQGSLRGVLRLLLLRLLQLLPLVALLACYLLSNRGSRLPVDLSYLFSMSRLVELFTGLLSFSTVYFSPWQILPAALYQFVLLAMLLGCFRERLSGQHPFSSGQRALFLLALAVILIYLAAPFSFGGGSYFNQRFPWVILLLLLPLLVGCDMQRHIVTRVGSLVVSVLFLGCNTLLFSQQSAQVAVFLRGMRLGCVSGEGLLLYKENRPGWPLVDVILHAPSYYGMNNGCVNLGNYETEQPYFPVRFRKEFPPHPSLAQIYLDPARIDLTAYPVIKRLLGWDLNPDARKRIERNYALCLDSDKLTVWYRR